MNPLDFSLNIESSLFVMFISEENSKYQTSNLFTLTMDIANADDDLWVNIQWVRGKLYLFIQGNRGSVQKVSHGYSNCLGLSGHV